MTGSSPRFLSVDDVLRLHRIAIADQGGDPGIRDRGLLESALAQPTQQIAGQYTHDDIPSMAAAYLYHLCRNHPFVDGNKRAGLAASIAFLIDNDYHISASHQEVERAVLSTADGSWSKERLTLWMRNCTTHRGERA
ncbi:MAG: type II toxin-antitoxin system death-on-curing family toxin [Planctomycetota bacterium]